MFWKCMSLKHSEENDKLRKEIIELQAECERYNQYIDQLKQDKKDLVEREKIKNSCQVVINFETMNVFSIERMQDRNLVWRTIIGYFIENCGEKKVKEWTLYITPEQHEALCNEFKDFMSLQ